MNTPSQKQAPHPAWGWVWLGSFILLLGFCVLPEVLVLFILHPLYVFLTGWFFFLLRLGPQIYIEPTSLVALSLASIGFILLTWYFISSLCSDKAAKSSMKFRHSFLIYLGFVATLMSGLSFVVIAQQLYGLTQEPRIIELRMQAAGRTQTRNNLKEIGLAAHNYHDQWNTFPSGGTLLDQAIPGHSWQTTLLPYMYQDELFQQIDLQQSWLAPRNKAPLSAIIPIFINPWIDISRRYGQTGYALSHYAGNVHLLVPGKSISLDQISDGYSQTLFAGEVVSNFKPWGDPTNSRDPTLGLNTSPQGFGGPWSGGSTAFLMADGSARHISDKIDPKILKALATPNGNEQIPEDW